MERQILHVDVNNAFLSWTAIDRLAHGEELDIRTIPAIIGGDEAQRKGVVLAKSTIAKQFGIKTGEPIYFARKKCPDIKVYQGDFKVYRKYSNALYQLLLEYTDQIERFSIDECFCDLTHFIRPGETLFDKAKEINKRVREELGFTVNVGVAHNKLLAKMASDFQKPDRVHTLFENEIETKMFPLPISELFMVGRKTLPKLERLGIKTIGDLAKRDQKEMIKLFGKHGKLMWEYANGIDEEEVISKFILPKCIGNSITLPQDIYEIEKLNEILLALSEQVSYRLRKYDLQAKVVNVQIKTSDFLVYSHQKSLDIPTNSTKEIYENAKELLLDLHKNRSVRLLGVRVDHLSEKNEMQISLFDNEKSEKQEKLDKAIDSLKERFGYNSVTRAGKMKINNIIRFKEEE